eukprot:scaffold2878_cov73-Phaeocystis_antarctica.AAC.2
MGVLAAELELELQPVTTKGRSRSAHSRAYVRPAGVSSGQYRQNSGLPLVHSQPTAVEREQAHAKILSASARTVPYPAPALSLHYIATPHLPLRLQASPLNSDPGRYHGSGWTGHISKFGATASRKGLNCNPDPPDC